MAEHQHPGGSGYLVAPESGTGRALLVLHSWLGLTEPTQAICNDLSDLGYVVLAPDLVGDARTTENPDQAKAWLSEGDMNVVADLVTSSAILLRTTTTTPDAPIGVLGFQMGASWALWLASRRPDLVGALCFFYGTQQVDHLNITCPVQGHFAESDPLVSEDEKMLLSATLHLEHTEVECFDYAGTKSGFFEQGSTFDSGAAELASERMHRRGASRKSERVGILVPHML